MQYSITNLNIFILLIAVCYSLYLYKKSNSNEGETDASNKDNLPVQLISEIKGYFYINPILALSLAITLFSFVGIPPLIGFFAKQMVLSSTLDSGYLFIVLIVILSSVISAYYYLVLVKQIFFNKGDYELSPILQATTFKVSLSSKILNKKNDQKSKAD